MDDTVNTRRDAGSYESSGCERGMSPLLDANAIYAGFRKSQRGSAWKEQVQRFEMNFLSEIARLQRDLADQSYRQSPASTFALRERGKTRVITGEQIRDRTVKHVLCDDILLPAIRSRIIHDSGASLPGKGIDFTRRRLVRHLCRYYREYGNRGYVLLTDFTKFYDNMRHDMLRRILFDATDDETARFVINLALEGARIDVSWMDDEEYRACMDGVFNSLQYQGIPAELKTGTRYLDKHVNIGDQLAQIAGVSYPMELDSYIKVVRGVRYYARYMDDCYVLHPDRGYLRELQDDMTKRAAEIGITMNTRKTHICKISDYWRFLQIQYRLTETGRIVRKIHPKAMARERRKMKKLAPILPEKQFHDWFCSWYLSYRKYMSRKQRQGIMTLFNQLKEENACIQSDLLTGRA